MQFTTLLHGLACVLPTLVLETGGVARAADVPEPATVDLTLIENIEPHTRSVFTSDRDGLIRWSFGKAGGSMAIQLSEGNVRLDTNGDGIIDDKDEPAFRPNSWRSTRVHVPVEIAGKKVRYPLNIHGAFGGQSDRRSVGISAAAALQGHLGDWTITVYDGNIDGRFGGDGDYLSIQKTAAPPKQASPPLPWAGARVLDGRIYGLELLGEGAQLKLLPYTGPVAEVTIETAESFRATQVTLLEATNAQVTQLVPAETGLLIPGRYRIHDMYCQAGPVGSSQHLFARHGRQMAPLELKPGKNVIKVGPPLSASFVATLSGLTLQVEKVAITGSAGETYDVARQEEACVVYIKSNGKEQKLGGLDLSRGGSVLVPEELATAPDAMVIVRIQTVAVGRLEVSRKLSDVPKARGGIGKALRSLLGR